MYWHGFLLALITTAAAALPFGRVLTLRLCWAAWHVPGDAAAQINIGFGVARRGTLASASTRHGASRSRCNSHFGVAPYRRVGEMPEEG